MTLDRAAGIGVMALVGLSLGWSAASGQSASGHGAAKSSSSVAATGSRKAAQKAASRYTAAAAQIRRVALARARELASLSIPLYKIDAQGDLVPDIRAEAAVIYNPATDQVLWEEHSHDQRSIASITKVMTALCFLETEPDLEQVVTIERGDVYGANTTFLRANERVSVDALLHLLLIASDNGAARTLARVSSYGAGGFVDRMNQKAAALGLQSTSYADPSGLDPNNVASAYDMARLITYAAGEERISSLMRTEHCTVWTNRRLIQIHNTNQLLRTASVDVVGGKTGFIAKAGYCLAALLRVPALDQTVAVVVLGARSNAARFMETRHLLDWISTRIPLLSVKEPHQAPPPSAPSR
jgi:D-alanyl-D-alanine endopeptidase (penicillin-binding protein 7)